MRPGQHFQKYHILSTSETRVLVLNIPSLLALLIIVVRQRTGMLVLFIIDYHVYASISTIVYNSSCMSYARAILYYTYR